MLTLKDCIDYVGLTEDEVDAIAEHEHISGIVAAELGNYLVESAQGVPVLKRMIVEDIERALSHGNQERAETLMLVMRHFIETHPEQSP